MKALAVLSLVLALNAFVRAQRAVCQFSAGLVSLFASAALLCIMIRTTPGHALIFASHHVLPFCSGIIICTLCVSRARESGRWLSRGALILLGSIVVAATVVEPFLFMNDRFARVRQIFAFE